MPVTIRDVASSSDVSIQTVSAVLSGKGKYRDATKRRVFAEAKRLGYRPNAAARAMARRSTQIVGALLINTSPGIEVAPFYNQATYELLIGAEVRLQESGFILALVSVADVVGADAKPSRIFAERVLDGVIAMGRLQDRVSETVRQIAPHTIWAEANTWSAHHCVRRDEVFAGRMVAEKLIDAGWSRLLWLGGLPDHGPESHFSGPQRRDGFLAVCRERGVPFEELHLTKEDRAAWPSQTLAHLLRAGVGVGAYDGVYATWAHQTGLGAGLRWGRDLGLACCDDSRTIAEHLPGLSRVSFSRYDIGRQAADMMLRRIANPRESVESQLQRGEWIEGSTLSGRA